MKPSYAIVQLWDDGIPGDRIVINRDKIISVEPLEYFVVTELVSKIRVRMMDDITFHVNAEPTLENMQSLMPL